MSTYWGYHCRTDHEHSPNWFNHGEDILRDAISLLPAVDATDQCKTGLFTIVGPSEGTGPPGLFDWLKQHRGHDLELESQYGDREPVQRDEPDCLCRYAIKQKPGQPTVHDQRCPFAHD